MVKEENFFITANSIGAVNEEQYKKLYWKYDLDSHKWKEKCMVQLKPEEKLVLSLCTQGLTMNEIAGKMCKSIDSIKFYRRTLFEKIGTRNITEALTFATIYKLL